jgi:hypothetical protein
MKIQVEFHENIDKSRCNLIKKDWAREARLIIRAAEEGLAFLIQENIGPEHSELNNDKYLPELWMTIGTSYWQFTGPAWGHYLVLILNFQIVSPCVNFQR